VAELIEHEQRVVAGTVEVAVPGGAFLRAVDRLTELSMSSVIHLSGFAAWWRSIQRPGMSGSATRFSGVVSTSVSNRPIWLAEAA
jgi:hypothetical protein